jgi:hypothetical protein
MQQGDGGGLRYAMQTDASVARARSATGQPESFSALFDMASSRAHQAAHPTDDDQERRADYTDADLLRCVSWHLVSDL